MKYTIRVLMLAFPILILIMAAGASAKEKPKADPALIDRWIEMYNTADISRADEIFASDFVPHMPAFLGIMDRAGYLWKIANPGVLDVHVIMHDLFGAGDELMGRFTVTAVLPPDLPYTNTFIVLFRFENDLIAEEWWEADFQGVLEQIGVMPRTRLLYEWSAPSAVTGDPGVPGQNASLVVRSMQAVNAKNFVLLEQVISVDFVYHDVALPFAQDLAGLVAFEENLFAAFPDQHVTMEDLVASGDRVGIRWSITGRHEGSFAGVPASGRTVHYSAMGIFRIADRKIVEEWETVDVLALMQQLTAP